MLNPALESELEVDERRPRVLPKVDRNLLESEVSAMTQYEIER